MLNFLYTLSMLIIRFLRVGKKNQPSFKVVVTDKRNSPRGGRFVEEVGFYNPLTKEKVLKKERVKYWIGQGAKPSDTVHNLLVKEGVLKTAKIPKHKKSKKKKESEEAPKAEPPKVEPPKAEVLKEKAPKEEEVPKEEKPKEPAVAPPGGATNKREEGSGKVR